MSTDILRLPVSARLNALIGRTALFQLAVLAASSSAEGRPATRAGASPRTLA
ncbi:MAG: hypothetical protein R3D80_21475 [Paracoccaceae bacterium]